MVASLPLEMPFYKPPLEMPFYKPSCLFQQVGANWWVQYLVHLLRPKSDEMMMIVWSFVHTTTDQLSLMCCNCNHPFANIKSTSEELANSWKLAHQYPSKKKNSHNSTFLFERTLLFLCPGADLRSNYRMNRSPAATSSDARPQAPCSNHC
jgi:hypothetical protein